MTLLHALLLALVEGITEFLPISSTGHLILTTKLLGLPESAFTKSFDIIIQLGPILAIFLLFIKRLWNLRKQWPKIITAFLPTALIGLLVYPFLKKYLLGNSILVAFSLIMGGIILICFEKWYAKHVHANLTSEQLSYKSAFIIGLCQALAIIPGVSRSGATIVGAMLLGLSRSSALEFSFLLALPTMAAATGLDVLKNAHNFSSSEWQLLAIGFIGSFVSALVVVRWLTRYVQNHTFKIFGIYRIVVGILFLLLVR